MRIVKYVKAEKNSDRGRCWIKRVSNIHFLFFENPSINSYSTTITMNSAMRGACFVLVITGSILAIKILYKRLRRPPANGCNLGRAKTLSNSVNTVQKGQPYDPSHPTIVIIGAGAVGLSTAYELAKANHALQQKQNIAVVDVYDSPFGATSNWNTGILGYSEFPPKLRPLGEYSFSLWQQLAQTAQFRERCGFKECSNFSVSSGGGDGLQLLPNWIRKCRWWDAWRDPPKAQSAIMSVLQRIYVDCSD
jgi:hypothetical protein